MPSSPTHRGGFEPPTSRFVVARSIQLNYQCKRAASRIRTGIICLEGRGLAVGRSPLRNNDNGPGRGRTSTLRLNRPLLHRLSYRSGVTIALGAQDPRRATLSYALVKEPNAPRRIRTAAACHVTAPLLPLSYRRNDTTRGETSQGVQGIDPDPQRSDRPRRRTHTIVRKAPARAMTPADRRGRPSRDSDSQGRPSRVKIEASCLDRPACQSDLAAVDWLRAVDSSLQDVVLCSREVPCST